MLYLGAVIICDAFLATGGVFVVVLNGSEALHILLFCSRRLSFIHLCLPAFIEEAPALKVENDHALLFFFINLLSNQMQLADKQA